jgi:endonuclease/exonuclease/phosphatase (EEP) superfamily protein YafD
MRFLRVALKGLFAGLLVAMGVVCAAAATLGHGGRFDLRLDMLTHFAPFWLAGGLTALLAGLAFHRGPVKVIVVTLGALATVAAGALMAPEYRRPMSPLAPETAPRQLKVIQYNAWGRNAEVARSAQWLADQAADIVVVEEADQQIRDALLERRDYYVTCKRCSVMIFSRAKPIAIGLKPRGPPGPRPPATRATFASPDGDFTVIGVHYTWPTPDGMQQAQGRRLETYIDRYPKDRLIVAGDLNSTPWSFTRRDEDRRFGLERRTRALFSWPAQEFSRRRLRVPFPFLPIDHVYAGSGWRTVKVERGPVLGSDHYPVIVTLAPAAAS